MNKTLKTTLFCLLCFAMYPSAHAESLTASQTVQSTTEQMVAVLKKNEDKLKKDESLVFSLVEKILLPSFDFERASYELLKKYWKRASDDEKQRFINQFQAWLMNFYGKAFLEYTDQKIEYLEKRGNFCSKPTDEPVRSKIVQPGNLYIPIDYCLHKVDNQWKVYDVRIEHRSLVLKFKRSFLKRIRKSGMEGLIKWLEKKNAGKK